MLTVFLYILPLLTQPRDFCKVFGSMYEVDSPNQADFIVYEELSEGSADLVVYEQTNRLYANRSGMWFFEEDQSFARYRVYFTNDKSKAHFSAYFTTFESFAGCSP